MRKLESSLRFSEEEILRTRKEAEKKIKKMSTAIAPASAREETLTQENEGLWVGTGPCDPLRSINVFRLQKIVKCTTCKQGMREVVLTKCMHSTSSCSILVTALTLRLYAAFCKPCVDSRISTRQRRCPNCNLAFAQSEVQTVYFQ